MSSYFTVNIHACIDGNHRLKCAWSDKTPMKVSLICVTCSGNGKTAFAAYGDDTKSFGQWRSRRRDREASDEETS